MGRIVISQNVTIDGVVEDPTGDGGFARGGWANGMSGRDREAWAQILCEEALRAEAMLLGRRSYHYFASRWVSRTGAWADRLNSMPKYIVSSTLENPEWNNSTVLSGDVLEQVSKLREQLDGEIVLYASAPLVHELFEHDLFDEVRLLTYPLVLGGGVRVFGATAQAKPLRRTDIRAVGDSLALLTYQPVREG